MKNNSIMAVFAIIIVFSAGCRDEFSNINTDPSVVTKPNVPYLFSQGILEFNPTDYLLWFYNGRYMSQLSQAYIPTTGFSDSYNYVITEMGGQGKQTISVLKYAREIDVVLKNMKEEERSKYVQLRAMLNPLIVFLGLFDSDMYGSRPFSEAAMARWGGTLTPKYDTVEELYNLFLDMLNGSLKVFATPPKAQINLANQDIIYKGDVDKWAKLTNSLKLKIAVRLLHQDKAKAIRIAEEVVSNQVGILDDLSDDFVFNKGLYKYNTGNAVSAGAIAKPVADFMLKNEDPRIRFVAGKNDYNSKIVQAFFDQEFVGGTLAKLPEFILQNVDYTIENGKKIFRAWKGLGEPWVRYYGIPTDMDARLNGKNKDYFETNQWKIGQEGKEKRFAPYSLWNEEMVRGRVHYTIPTAPNDRVIQDNIDNPWFFMYFTTAEANLYLAEFKLLGANLPKSAKEYYEVGLKASVEVYNRVAGLNKIPYYGTTYGYDANEKVIDLMDGEIDTMMTKSDYQLTGSTAEQLEKVYIQQFLHFMLNPTDQYVSLRRSGVPKTNSQLLAWNPIVPANMIPRRMIVLPPSPASIMYNIEMEAYKTQGFTPSSAGNPSLLNSERVWQDKGAPHFGEGPNF